jgi:hypothetical protein
MNSKLKKSIPVTKEQQTFILFSMLAQPYSFILVRLPIRGVVRHEHDSGIRDRPVLRNLFPLLSSIARLGKFDQFVG